MSIQLQALLLELLVSGFFAIACFKARAAREPGALAMSPRDFLKLTDRLDRLSRTRYQWVAVAAILILVRMQAGVPITVELTALAEFIVFLALPVGKTEKSLPAAKEETRPTRAERSVKSLRRLKRAALASAEH